VVVEQDIDAQTLHIQDALNAREQWREISIGMAAELFTEMISGIVESVSRRRQDND
jgi:hypothetical protein